MRLAGGDDTSKKRSKADLLIAAKLAAKLRDGPYQKQRVARVRDAILSSEYENPLKLAVAIDRLIDRLPTEPKASMKSTSRGSRRTRS